MSNEAGVWWLRHGVPLPHHGANENTTETVFDYEDGERRFKIHSWRPNDLPGKSSPAVIMFHGGGWMIGNISMHRRFYSNIAHHLNMVVISPEYTLSPDAGVPLAAYADCMATIKYVHDNANQFRIDPERIVLSGDSAGGQLTLATGLNARVELGVDIKDCRCRKIDNRF